MMKLIKKKQNQKENLFLKSSLGNIDIFFIDKIIRTPNNVNIINNAKGLSFQSDLGALFLPIQDNLFIFYKKNKLLLSFDNVENKKSLLNLYIKLIRMKIRGVLQGFKLTLMLKGVGFKAFLEKNSIKLKLGYSHLISIPIPDNINVLNQTNSLIFHSMDYISLTKYVHYIKTFKKPEPYKGKGLLLKNEKVLRKEGKKSKK